VATLVVVLDVVTKVVVVAALSDGREHTLIPKVLDLELTRNSGAAFSLGTGSTVVFTLVAAVVVVAIARSARRLVSRGWAISLGLLLGGALGNLIDRLVRAPGPGRGAVVDWIHLHHWPVFNAADSAIVVGAVLAAVLSIRGTAMTATPAVPAAAGEGDSDE
jgi:signal peptidase II